MPLSLICACGARLELEDSFAGQEVACPECQQPLKAPAGTAQNQPVRTSAFALASLILAVIGAFTLVGTVAAIVFGVIALVTIVRHRDRLAGLGYAVSGIVIGVVFTLLTLFAVTTAEPFGFAGWMREKNMADLVDTTGPLEVANKGWTITRPTEHWGVARNGLVNDPIAELFLKKSFPDVLLVQIKHNAFVDVHEDANLNKQTLDGFLSQYQSEYQEPDVNPFIDDPKGQDEGFMRISHGVVKKSRHLTTLPPGCEEGREVEMEVQAAGQKWIMIVRIYRQVEKKQGPEKSRFYVLRAYTPRRWFTQNQAEFEKALDSFRLVK
jgi:Domain of unknown function (DUF4190)